MTSPLAECPLCGGVEGTHDTGCVALEFTGATVHTGTPPGCALVVLSPMGVQVSHADDVNPRIFGAAIRDIGNRMLGGDPLATMDADRDGVIDQAGQLPYSMAPVETNRMLLRGVPTNPRCKPKVRRRVLKVVSP